MDYQLKNLSDMSDVGVAGPLPPYLARHADVSLADLSASVSAYACDAFGWTGRGYFPASPPVPAVVSRMQAKMALSDAGLLSVVEAAIGTAPEEVQIYWQEASEFHRDHPVLGAITTQLGLTSDQVDALFVAAGQIT